MRRTCQLLQVDVTLVRVLFVGLAVFCGSGLVLYVAMWILVPDASKVPPPTGGVAVQCQGPVLAHPDMYQLRDRKTPYPQHPSALGGKIMSYAAKVYILAIVVLAAGWALGRAYEKVSDRDATGSNWWLRVASWVLYGLGFLIGSGGTALALDAANDPDKYGGP